MILLETAIEKSVDSLPSSTVSINPAEFARLIEQFQAGDTTVVAQLYAAYGGVVREAVRRQLPDQLRKEYDSLDFVHDVWASFCQIPPGTHQFKTPEALGGFLSRVAYNKVVDVCRRRLGTQKHDVTREQALVSGDDGGDVPVPSPSPSPSQWAIAGERWAAMAAKLSREHMMVIERLRDGFSQREVAAMAGIDDRTVRRIVDRARELCEDGS